MARGILSLSCRPPLILLALLVRNVVVTLSINQSSDSQNLIKFKNSLENNSSLSGWDASKEICSGDNSNWGNTIICDSGSVWGIKLENMGLKGTINIDALHEVKTLRSISLIKNKFDGPLPNFKKIRTLRALYISHNNFQGDIPSVAFDGMNYLKKLYMGSNKFTGKIPMSLITLPKLQELYLENNQFSGEVPAFSPGTVKIFNVANNKLEGQIPSALNFFNKASFAGNKGLCGKPLDSCTMSFVAKLSIATVTILTMTCFAAISALVVVIIILLRHNRTNHYDHGRRGIIGRDPTHFALPDLNRLERGSSSEITPITKRSPENENVMLSFLRDDRPTFDMNDLLKASAETLGNGVCGATYKAAIVGGPTMVVKRYKHMNNVDKVEFCDHMRRVGRLDHKNLLPFVAFYYRKEEKLLIFDHVDNDSLAVYLQGNGSGRPTSLDWQTRLKIIKGIARGLMYLHIELPNLVVPHGHLKSSNVLLNKVTMEPILTDYALVPLINQEQHYLTAYRSPEFQQMGHISKKTDVYGLGMLILEILTGKVPSNSWIESIAGTVLNPDIIDMDMPGKRGYESDMIKVLKIGLKCCEFDIEKRWDMTEAVEVIEGIKDKENNVDDDFYSVTSEERRSSRGSP